MTNFLFLHAHPDDEAIFTGGIIRKLVNDGESVHVIFTTGGELGNSSGADQDLDLIRKIESENAAKILGVRSVNFLGYHDSGLDANKFPTNAFANCDIEEASEKVLQIIRDKNIDVLFCDDEFGIYGHPDHIQANKLGVAVSKKAKLLELYFTTVDREYLHFVETHLVEEANIARSTFDLANNTLGMSSIEITHTIDVSDVLGLKRDAIAKHGSQIDESSSALMLNDDDFKAVYGHEWFLIDSNYSRSNSLLKYCI
jgi:LmbE family N-acetylglucosaminyl deacetylase